ncbi:MAG: HIT family protein [archaeon]
MSDCVFCKIIKGKVPCTKIYEDEHNFVFLSISPAVPEGGHTLVIPKKHYEHIDEMDEESYLNLMKTVHKFSKVLLKFGEGLNIVQNNHKIAGQVVPHVHFHLIPRFSDDHVEINYWKEHEFSKEKMKEVAEKIKKLSS